jgi:hypothetical protein
MFLKIVLAESWAENIPGLGWVLQFLREKFGGSIDNLIDTASSYAKALTVTEQIIWGAVLILILISGMVGLVKVVSKLAIVAAIIFAVWLLFQNNVF